jgi:hypothetical protein
MKKTMCFAALRATEPGADALSGVVNVFRSVLDATNESCVACLKEAADMGARADGALECAEY